MAKANELHSKIGRLITDARRTDQSAIRSDLFDRYMGEPYGDEVKGRSAFISTDVADAVEAILPDIMDVFTSTEGVVEFQPVGPEDEGAAQQETQVVEHIFWEKNDGFLILYTWFKEALIQQNSYVRRGWDDRERVEIEKYEALTADEFLAIMAEKSAKGAEYEVLDSEDHEDGTFDIELRCVTREKRYVIECIPQEEFFATPRWGKVSLDGIPCCGHRRDMERGELLRMGFAKRSVEAAFDGGDENEQTDGRHSTRDVFETETHVGDEATETVTVYEAYCRLDVNDDGKAELVRVWATGDGSRVLQWENGDDAIDEVSSLPFDCLTPYIVPHRHIGRSVAEIVDDVQRVKTVLMRTTLDNIYGTQYPRPHFDENAAGNYTYEDLQNVAHGAPVRTGGADIQWHVPPSIIGTTLPLMEKFDDLKEARTGATRYNQGLDAGSLNKTASGIRQIMNATQKKTLLIARTFAETGLRSLFMGIHRDLRAGPVKELAIKLRGQWVQTNPRLWADRTDMTIRVGGISREEKRGALMLIAQFQEKLAMSGSRLVGEQHMFETARELAASVGYRNPARFFADPASLPPPQPPPPDPMAQMAQAQLQLAQQDMQNRFTLQAQKLQQDGEKMMAEMQVKLRELARKEVETASRVQTDDERLELDRKRVVLDDDFKRDKLEVDAVTGAMRAAPKAATSAPPIDYGDV